VTSTSWEHQREVRDALRTIVSDPQLGVPALSSAQTMSNLLKDLLPDAPRETSVLVAAAEAGLAQILRDHVAQGMDLATASSLTASAFAARTPFTAEACNWAVAELAVALGLAPAEPAPAGETQVDSGQRAAGPAAPGFPAAAQAAAGETAETLLPGRDPAPGYGYPGAGQPGGPGQAPAAGAPAAPGAGYGYPGPGAGNYPPPPAAPPAQGYGYPPPVAPAMPPGAGYAYPPPTAPGGGPFAAPGQGGMPAPKRRAPKAWMIVTGAVVVVALIGVIAAVASNSGNSGTAIEPLSKIIQPDVTGCKSTVALGLTGLTHREFCQTSVHNIGLDAYQFATTAAYTSGLNRLNALTGWNASTAGTSCPPTGGNGGRTLWHSNVNATYRQRAGQLLECFTFNHNSSFLLYVWTLPTQRVILVANDNATGATFADLEKWWAGLSYG
jgi:hypothetical protein